MRLILLGLFFCAVLTANQGVSGWCEQGGQVVLTGSVLSTTTVQQSYPQCTVTVYITGTATKATIYSNNNSSPTPLTNPFIASVTGLWQFFAANGVYDVQFAGSNLPQPFTIGAISLFDYTQFSIAAAGLNTQIQFNQAGGLGASPNLEFNYTSNNLVVTGSILAQGTGVGTITATGGLVSSANSYRGVTSITDGALLSGYGVGSNFSNTLGGYIDLAPVTYNPYDGSPCTDFNGNTVTQPLPLMGLSAFGSNDTIMWVSTSPQMPASGSCGLPFPINLTYGLNINSYFFARGGLATDNPAFNAINTVYIGGGVPAGGVTAGAIIAGTLYPAGTVTTTGTLSTPQYLGGYIQVGFSNGPPAAGTISTQTNPLVEYDGIEAGTLYFDTALNCFNGRNNTTWTCLGGGGSSVPGGGPNSIQTNVSGSFYGDADYVYVPGSTVSLGNGASFTTNTTTGGFNASLCTNTDCIQARLGGILGLTLRTTDSVIWVAESEPVLSASNQARMYFDSTALILRCSFGGAAYASCAGSGGSGANTSLSNLSAVSINSSLLFQTGEDIGSSAHPARNLYLYGSGTYGTDYWEITGTPTSTWLLTLPNRTTAIAGTAGTLTNGDCAQFDSSGNIVDAGGACSTGGGGGTVSSATQYQVAYYTATGTVVGGSPNYTFNSSTHVLTVTGTATASTVNATSAFEVGGSTVVDSSKNASFLSLTINGNAIVGSAGAIQSPVTGSSVAFLTSNTDFEVDGQGDISIAGSGSTLYINGSTGGIGITANTATNSIQTVGGVHPITAGGGNCSYLLQASVSSLANCVTGDTMWALGESGNYGILRLSNGSGSGGLDGNGAQIYALASSGDLSVTGTITSAAATSGITFQNASPYNFQVNGNGVVSLAGQLNLNSSATITTYKGVATAGYGVAPIYAQAGANNQTSYIALTNMQPGGSAAPAGLYRVNFDLWCGGSSGGTGVVGIVFSWQQQGTTQYSSTIPISCGTSNTGTEANNLGSMAFNTYTRNFTTTATFYHQGSADIQYGTDVYTAFSGGTNYSLQIVLERLN